MCQSAGLLDWFRAWLCREVRLSDIFKQYGCKGQLSSGYPIFTRSYLVLHRARSHTRCGVYIS
jgi:hypothetical protein